MRENANLQYEVQALVDEACPNHGISFGRLGDKATWRVDFKPEATEQQRGEAILAIAAFDVSAFENSQERARMVSEIESERDAAMLSGVTWNGNMYHIDPTFQAQITGLVAAFEVGILPAQAAVPIRRVDNTIEQLNFAQLKSLAGSVLVRVQEIWSESWAAKDELP